MIMYGQDHLLSPQASALHNMTNNMAKGSQLPSVYDKINKQSHLIFRLSHDMLLSRNSSDVKRPHLHLKWRSKLFRGLEAPSEKGTAKRGFERSLGNFIADVVSETAAAPFNRVKLLIQNEHELLKRGRLFDPYRGPDECFVRTIRVEGYLSLWRGHTANIIGCVTTQALEVSLNDYFVRPYFFKFKKNYRRGSIESYCKLFAWKMAANSIVAVSPLLFVYPLDYAHTRLANDIVKASPHFGFSMDTAYKKGGVGDQYQRQFNGMIDVYKKTLKSDGIVGLYRGFSVSCLGTIVHTGLYVGTYFTLVPLIFAFRLMKENSYNRLMIQFWVLAATGLAYHPFDTIRRRMMMTSGEAFKYNNPWDAFFHIVQNEGPKSLFKGVSATLVHSFVRAVALFGCVALTHRKEYRS